MTDKVVTRFHSLKRKTPAFFEAGRARKPVPCFINGRLSKRPRGVTKCLVYWFDAAGDLQIALVAISRVQEAEFQLEG